MEILMPACAETGSRICYWSLRSSSVSSHYQSHYAIDDVRWQL